MKKKQKLWRGLSVTLLILSQIPFGILVQGETQDNNPALGKVIVKKNGRKCYAIRQSYFCVEK